MPKIAKKEIKKEVPVAEKEIKKPKIEVELFDLPSKDAIDTNKEIASIDEEMPENGKEKFYQSIGRRKVAIARIRIYTKKSTDTITEEHALITINGKDYTKYFEDKNLQLVVESPLRKLKSLTRFKVTAVVNGGGIAGQAGAVRHGIARALTDFDLNFKKKLKKAGFLTRDPRAKERRKYGLKKARKSPQWSKR
ncbi:MAG: 30S ribosomal protein S9 [Parcubacteria group bacterium GW2011_GWC1_39_29]|uniref:Small ribosomal subunit protein uS9 n=1 Tax=Candidatus Yanofskybacteria bacterium GW2011_GWD1_39_16 TaxID=1619030 RepID=A0A837HSH1_9BACT|nr:MAG: 30S ribosomal protein S9 [Candidatus Yanofskybacteria bacterium GW2011_GWD1_39_16]KKR14787.1 MAG: 30S ribosomal protein S9 [Parcubacteria group bacterium GW2011_GWC1_39_29]